jgi:hypothetical protein
LALGCPPLALGFQDEVWWSRLAQPSLSAWTAAKPLRLVEQEAPKADRDRKALACDGLLLPQTDTEVAILFRTHGDKSNRYP